MSNSSESFFPLILLVNDAPDTLNLMKLALTNEGFRVVTATNGRDAWEIALSSRLDAVVSDVVMPEMDGVELCQKLKAHPKTVCLPVILVSAARTEVGDAVSGLNAGADDYIVLPFRQSELLIKLTRLIERSRSDEKLRAIERQYQTVVQNSPVVFFALDKEGITLLSEGAGLEKLGFTSGEVVGQSVFDIYRDNPEVIANVRRALQGETFTAATNFNDLIYEVSYNPIFDSEGRVSGTMGVAADITGRVKAERKAETVIEQLGIALERAALINRISTTVRESLQAEDVFRTVVNELGISLQVDRSHLYFFDESAQVVRSSAQYAAPGVPSISQEEIPYALADRILPAFRENGYVVIDDAANSPEIKELYENVLRPRGVRSIMFVAIRVGSQIIGLMSLVTVTYHKQWSESDVTLALAVADQAGIAIRQAQLYQQTETTLQRERLINQLSTAIRSSLKLPSVLHTATSELGKALGASHVYLRFHNEPETEIKPEHLYKAPSVSEPDPTAIAKEHPAAQFIQQKRQTVVISDVSQMSAEFALMRDSSAAAMTGRGVRSALYCPIWVNDSFRGAICIEQTDRLRRWTESEIALIEGVSAQLSLGIAHAELFELTRRVKRDWEVTFDAMSDGVFIFDNAGILVRVNKAGAAMEKSTPSQIIGRECCQILCDDDGVQECIVEEIVKTRRAITVEYVAKTLKRPVLITTEPIVSNNNALVGVVCTVRDLYELRKAEAVARDRHSLLIHILEGVLEPIFAVDARGKLLWGNKATRDSYGIGKGQIKNRLFAEMFHPEDRAAAAASFAASLHKVPQFYEARYITAEGKTRHAIFNSVPLQADGRINGVLWFVRDITQQKQALEQALQADKLRALGQLASGVAHDFNNVLAAIQGRISLLERLDLDENVRRNLQIIQTAAEDAAATVRRIQSFARQNPEPDFTLVDIGSLLRDAVELMRPRWHEQALERDIKYTVFLDCDGNFVTRGNASELREVFINLLINALDAMPHGGELKIDCCRADDDTIEMRFADDGEGISSEVLERIFEPFFSTKGVDGMGLGLSVSYGIIKQHGGDISVESRIGVGSTFKLTLPVQTVIQSEAQMLKSNGAKQELSVLVVDDEEYVREALIEMVSELATEVIGAQSVAQAIEKLEEKHFDVVFTDLSMPELDGWDLAREINRKWNYTKTVLVTGYGKGVAMTPEKRRLIHAVIGKPFNFTQLSQTLGKISVNDKSH